MSALVQIHDVDFTFASGRGSRRTDQAVLRGVTLDIEPGSTLGLIGPNGGGKTTLVRLLLGLLTPARGSILIDGLAPAAAVARGDVIGYLPQRSAGDRRFPISVRQAVRLGLAGKTGVFRGYDPADLDFVDELLERVGLAELSDRPIGSLSGGQAQRAYIARALAPRPRLLVLDEPTTGIDPAGQQQFIELLQALKAGLGLTVVFVSHDLRAVAAISNRIACLNGALHYHDVPDRLPAGLVYQMFACDLQALGIGADPVCCPSAHPRLAVEAPATVG